MRLGSQYIRTTVGRILLNQIVSESIQKDSSEQTEINLPLLSS